MKPSTELQRLLSIMAKLRDPKTGCPWDLEQTFQSLAPYALEEAYEVVDAIQNNDMNSLKEELGDLLFQVVFHAQLAAEKGLFDFEDIARGIADKMVRRHSHIFGNDSVGSAKTAEEQSIRWEEHKEAEKKTLSAHMSKESSVLDGVPLALPAITRALKLQQKAARVGFDWPTVQPMFDKLQEEIIELQQELHLMNPKRLSHELGDILFVIINIARKININPEASLAETNKRFYKRFNMIEQFLKIKNEDINNTTLENLEKLWLLAKSKEKEEEGKV